MPGFVADVLLDEAAVIRLLHDLWNPVYAVDEAAIRACRKLNEK